MARELLVVALVAALLAGCQDGSEPAREGREGPTSQPAREGRERQTSQRGVCPVTLPNKSVPADPAAGDWGQPDDDSHGNGKIWTLLWPYGVVLAPPDYVEKDGSIGVKWPWWRGVKGTLKIEGRRLDQPARPLRADINDAYGTIGFQPTGVYFASEGCWEVTGRVGAASLTFVTLVAKGSTYGFEMKRD